MNGKEDNDSMTEEETDKEFWKRADKFIDTANKLSVDTAIGPVSSSLLYAAARFNAFIVYSNAENAEQMKQDKDAAVEYFSDQYKNMLEENLDDHIQNFEQYSTRKS